MSAVEPDGCRDARSRWIAVMTGLGIRKWWEDWKAGGATSIPYHAGRRDIQRGYLPGSSWGAPGQADDIGPDGEADPTTQEQGARLMNPITTPVVCCYEFDGDEWTIAIYSPTGDEQRLRNRTIHGKLCHVYECDRDGMTRAIPQETGPTDP
jgi:hypothetical protein